ncbi:hypothetical protein SAMD00019534_038110 [Acytostelium subglobosum LB1]|uniref:hypothetical protein n=1 Tax=Acytostelium subglobosum LB1 TaxID=1410327 RepID=UPI000644C7FD|nr:hypothetical protein SAMD00019534_038110 [Acytostelium subglobosum LB1]GAM20636.1 hypothetical protein SAMD00019534_038110 [Acytostelium subglobosum LB1]|eukprot:XP_012760157.1 hypothetical protein SAMD00019534_038110 [Acytostelium subglobosum LB1]
MEIDNNSNNNDNNNNNNNNNNNATPMTTTTSGNDDLYKLSRELRGHEKDVRAVIALYDGRIVSGSRDNTVRVWDIFKSQNQEATSIVLHAHQHFVGALTQLKPNELLQQRLFASGGNDKMICVWDKNAVPRGDSGIPSGSPILMLLGHTDSVSTLGTTHDGLLISGSWDKSVRVWDNNDCVCTLEKHEAAVWSVLGLPNGDIVSASADKKIIIWKRVQNDTKIQFIQYKVLTKHTDCVRALSLIPEVGFISAANDGSLIVWTFDGEPLQEMTGHQAYVYGVVYIPNYGYVSCSEDRSIKVWKDGACHQTLAHPSGVWSCAVLLNGDLVSGCADGVVRVWTRNPTRVASGAAIENYLQSVAAQEISSDNVGDIKLNELPEAADALLAPGKKDGEMKVVRSGKTAEAHQWSAADQRWIKIGDVIDSNASKSKALLDGKEYDYVFDIDVNEGTMYKIGYNNGENPWTVAQEFLWKNDLDQSWLEEITKFLVRNANAPSNMTLGAAQPTYSDPFTGGSRYVPGSAPTHQPASTPSFAEIQPNNYIPQGVYTYFDAANSDSLAPKALEYSQQLAADTATKALSLDLEEREDVVFKNILSTLKDTSRYHSSTFSDVQYKTLLKMLKWPVDKILPLLDVLRTLMLHSGASRTFDQMINMKQFNVVQALLNLPATASDINNQMLIAKVFCNMIRHENMRQHVYNYMPAILDRLHPFYETVSNSNATFVTSYSTLLLNLSVLTVYKKDFIAKENVDKLINCVSAMIVKEQTNADVVFRLVIALGSILITFRQHKVKNGKEIESIIQKSSATNAKLQETSTLAIKLLQ